jgi:hypothetical protein
MKRQLVFIFILIVLCNCENVEQKNNKELDKKTKKNNEILVNTFNNRRENIDNFFFLDYWFGMSNTEYQIISDSLVNNNIIFIENNSYRITLKVIEIKSYINYSETFTITHEPKFFFNPTFIENELVCLDLVLYSPKSSIDDNIDYSSTKHIIRLYKEKYGSCITNQPNPIPYTAKLPSLKSSNKDKNTYYEFTEYIWNMNNYLIINYERRGLTSSVFINGSFPVTNYFKISYLTTDYYKKMLDEKNKRQIEKEEKIEKIKKETFDKI